MGRRRSILWDFLFSSLPLLLLFNSENVATEADSTTTTSAPKADFQGDEGDKNPINRTTAAGAIDDDDDGKLNSHQHEGGGGFKIGYDVLVSAVLGLLQVAAAVVCIYRVFLMVKYGRRLENEDVHDCYVCHQNAYIFENDWERHRRGCARRNANKLARMPAHPLARCPMCDAQLRLMPESSDQFKCSRFACKRLNDRYVVNNGSNRYNCFKCDYDACDRCIEEIQGNVLAFGTTYNPRDEVDAREREFYHRRRKDRDEAREKAKGHWAVAVKKKTIGKLSLAKAVNQLKLQQQLEQQPQQQQQQQTRHENPWTVAAAANCSNSFRPNHVTTTSSPSLSQQPPPPPPPPPQRPPSQPLTSFRDRIKRIRLRKADGEDDNAVRLPDKASTTLVATEPLAILMNEAGPWMRRPSSSPIMKTPAERDRESQQGHFRHTHQHQHQHHNQPQPQPQPQQQQQQQHPRQLYQHQRRVRMREEEDDEEEEEDEDGDEQSQQQQQQYHSHFRPTVVAVMPRDIFNSHQHQQQTSCRRKPASAAVVSESVEVIIEPRRRQDEDEDGSSEDDLDGHEEDPYYQEDRRALRAANPNVWFESEL